MIYSNSKELVPYNSLKITLANVNRLFLYLDVKVLSCVDGSFYARVNLSDFDVCMLRSCVRHFDAVDITAGLDKVRTLGPNQTSGLASPDSASGCPNFSPF
jgi:hypothetical protein